MRLVEDGTVNGWDDPRMPTIAGMRRRGYPAAALREFVKRGGVTKKDKLIEMSAFETCGTGEPRRDCAAANGCTAPVKGGVNQLPGRAGRNDGGQQPPEPS